MSDDQHEMITQPMVEALIARLQSLETRLESKLVQTAGATEQAIASMRAEMNENFSRVRDEIAILNEDTLKTRAGQRELLRRIEKLESKAS
ncbi:MAG: hypothetical protein AABO57_27525 [Acidobacteriota bacterium]